MKKYILTLFYSALIVMLYAQGGEAPNALEFQKAAWLDKQLVVPPSPEAASLGQFGENDYQVNLYTGGYTKTIPIHTIQGRDISLPISLQYNPNSVKVDNMPGWVGLGWSLSAGGSLTRSINAMVDKERNYFSQADSIMKYLIIPGAEADDNDDTSAPPSYHEFLYSVIDRTVETQPDNFYYSAGALSGKFYITPEEKIIEKTVNDVFINPTYSDKWGITSVSITDKNGTTYVFDVAEETYMAFSDMLADPIPTVFRDTFNSTLHLRSITSANKTEQILFNYETDAGFYNLSNFINHHQYKSKTFQTTVGNHNDCPVQNGVTTMGGADSETYIKNRRFLASIEYKLGNETIEVIEFASLSASNDCNFADPTSRKMDRIRIKRGKGTTESVMDYDFSYDCSSQRLMLNKIQEFAASSLPLNSVRTDFSIEKKEPYVFSYHNGNLPNPVTTVAMDHWGYHNGSTGNSLIPNQVYSGCAPLSFSGGTNRNTDFNQIKYGVLKQIDYPTGGYTELEIEPHLIQLSSCSGLNDMLGGGLRIKEVRNYDCNGDPLTKKRYNYQSSSGGSSGILLSSLEYLRENTYEYFPELQIPGDINNAEYTCTRQILSATNRSQLGTVQDSYVGYSRVEEIIEATDNTNETLGRTVYHFKNKKISGGEYEDVKNGLIDLVEVFNTSNDTLVKTFYEYSFDLGEQRNTERGFHGYTITPKNKQNNKIVLCQNPDGNWEWQTITNGCSADHTFTTKFEISRRYRMAQEWVYESKKTEQRYFYDNLNAPLGFVKTITNQVFGDTMVTQPTETTVTNSDGQVFKTIAKYTHSAANVPTKLLSNRRHQTALPFEEERYIDDELYYKTRIKFEEQSFGNGIGNGKFYPTEFYEQYGSAATEIPQGYADKFDIIGNVLEVHAEDGQPTSQIWSNENSQLAARVLNASFEEIAYTSFETEDAVQGNWNIPSPDRVDFFASGARSGNYAYKGSTSNAITTNVPSGRYIISYYINANPLTNNITISGANVIQLNKKESPVDAQGWYYVTHTIETSSSTTINFSFNSEDYLDELRIYPADALMTTFVYDEHTLLPISIMDENSIPARFEYDGLLRLTGIKNFNDHYLSLNEYLYKETANCSNTHNIIKNWTVLESGQLSASSAKSLSTSGVLKNYAYFDGLGRPIQSVGIDQSPAGNDIVQFVKYDKFGREDQKFLPYTVSGSANVFRTNPESEQASFFGGQFPGQGENDYGKMVYTLESSPLNRVFAERPEGNAFQTKLKVAKYELNGMEEVRNFHTAISPNNWYLPNTLYKTTQLDENENSIITYTDKIGRKVMQNQEGAKTYFLYDTKGLLVQIIQPETAEEGHINIALIKSDSVIEEGSFRYTYDAEYRLKTKKFPGSQVYTYFYNDLDQVVLTIDGKGFKTFTKYDKLGRPIISGRYNGSATPSPSQIVYEERSTVAPHYYTTNQSFPTDGNIDVYTVNYYDNYDINYDNTAEISYQNTSTGNYDAADYAFVRGKEIAKKVAILKSNGAAPDTYLNNYSFYDKFCRVIQINSDNHLAGTDIIWNKYNFPGWLMNSRKEHTTTINNQSNSIITNEEFTYDDVGRQINQYHQLGDNLADKQLVCSNSYNEREELVQKKIGGDTGGNNFLQTVDYTYNIRKWLTGINKDKLYDYNYLFGMRIDYGPNNFNGNIDLISWRQGMSGNPNLYYYEYDELNRLKTATFSDGEGVANFGTQYNYDLNGSIDNLSRDGLRLDNSYGQIDDLLYDYDNEGKLTSLQENSQKNAGFKSIMDDGIGTYSYDENGNLIIDEHKGITITYNFLNLPELVTKTAGSTVQWLYDALGNKLQKATTVETNLVINDNSIISNDYWAAETILSQGTIISGSNVTFTAGQRIELDAGFISDDHFVGQIQPNLAANEVRDYCLGIEYFAGQTDALYFDGGRIKYEGNNTDYQYVLADHLGNTRILFSDLNNDNSISQNEILDNNSYYPFGLQHQGANAKSSGSHNYLYNGKELDTDFGLNWYHYGARMYDPTIARFTGVDPISDRFAHVSTYNYAENRPISGIDLWGLQYVDKITGQSGPASPEHIASQSPLPAYAQAESISDGSPRPRAGNSSPTPTEPQQDTKVKPPRILSQANPWVLAALAVMSPVEFSNSSVPVPNPPYDTDSDLFNDSDDNQTISIFRAPKKGGEMERIMNGEITPFNYKGAMFWGDRPVAEKFMKSSSLHEGAVIELVLPKNVYNQIEWNYFDGLPPLKEYKIYEDQYWIINNHPKIKHHDPYYDW